MYQLEFSFLKRYHCNFKKVNANLRNDEGNGDTKNEAFIFLLLFLLCGSFSCVYHKIVQVLSRLVLLPKNSAMDRSYIGELKRQL